MSSSFYSQIGIPSTNSTAIQSSVNQAATSETNSAASATNSASSASASAASATSANAADVSATQSKNAAEAAETNAATSATSSATSATASSTSATQSAASAVTSANEATAAAASAVTSSTQATNAAASATSAASSLAAIGTSVTDAATSATAAASTLTTFQNQYLGAAATAPTLDPDGSALDLGDLWFDTASDTLKVYASGGWVNAGSSVNGTSERQTYTATAGQTTFAVTYDAGFVDVWLNGVKLLVGTDFTATSGSNIVLASGAATGDIIDIIAFGTFSLSTHLSQTDSDARYVNVSGDTMTGDLTVNGNLNVAGTTVTIDSANAQTVDLGDNDKIRMGDGDDLQIYHDGSNSYVDDTGTGRLYLRGNDRVQIQKYTGEDMITANADGAVNLYHDNSKKFETTATGVDVTGTVTADGLTVDTSDQVLINHSADGGGIRIDSTNATNTSSLRFGDVADNYIGALEYNHSNDSMTMYVNNASRMVIDSSGGVDISGGLVCSPNTAGKDTFQLSTNAVDEGRLRIKNVDTTTVQIRAGGDSYFNGGNVGIGTSSPTFTTGGGVQLVNSGFASFRATSGSNTGIDFSQNTDGKAYVYNRDNASLIFGTNNASRMVIDADGKVGVGLASNIGATLHVDPDTNVTTGFGTPLIKVGGANSWAGNGSIYSIGFGYNNGSTDKSPAEIGFDTTSSAGSTKGDLVFATRDSTANTAAPSERMRISSSGTTEFYGRVNVTRNQNSDFVAKFENNAGGGYGISSDNSAGNHIFFYRDGSQKGSITDNGSSTSFNTSSDYRLKENVTDISDGITRLKQLQPRRFNFIADADTTVDGFIAHEAAIIIPEAVTGTKDAVMDEEYEVKAAVTDDDGAIVEEAVMGTRSVPNYQGIDQSKIVPLLVAALQEAIAKIETLETRVTALEAE